MAFGLSSGAVSLIGGGLGLLAGSQNSTKTESGTKDPWAPAQPYILNNLQNESNLQSYYQKNPFNAQQIQGYSNLAGDTQNFRDNVMPGLMSFANNGMTSGYQRATGGVVGSGGGYGGARQPGGMVQSGAAGPFSVAQGAGARSTGVNPLLDLNGAQNPYKNGLLAAANPTPAATAPPSNNGAAAGGLLGTGGGGQGGNGIGGTSSGTDSGSSGNIYGIGSSFNTDAASKVMNLGSILGLPAAVLSALVAGIVGGNMTQDQINAQVASLDSALANKDAANHNSFGNGNGATGPGYSGAGIGGNVSEGSTGSSHFG